MWGDEPTRAELDREAYEERMAATYEDRFLAFCDEHLLDPHDLDSVHAYEAWWTEEQERSHGF